MTLSHRARNASDNDPAATRRAVLHVLSDGRRWPSRELRRLAQRERFGTDLFGASQTSLALRFLRDNGMVESGYNPNTAQFSGTWRITEYGRDWLELADMVVEATDGAA